METTPPFFVIVSIFFFLEVWMWTTRRDASAPNGSPHRNASISIHTVLAHNVIVMHTHSVHTHH